MHGSWMRTIINIAASPASVADYSGFYPALFDHSHRLRPVDSPPPYCVFLPMSKGRYLVAAVGVSVEAKREGDRERPSLVFSHVTDRSSHGDNEEDTEVHEQNRPVYRYVENREEGPNEDDGNSFRRRVPDHFVPYSVPAPFGAARRGREKRLTRT